MREIKFRAWEVYARKYYYNAEHTYDFMCSGDGCYSESFGTVLDDERFIVEQYTGLKDKNGKEIYEGDIVAEHNGDITGVITQCPSDGWRIEWIGIFGGSSSLYEHRDLCGVIGNIHENPGLLVEVTK